ncbi:MAG: alpha/beta hydrolase [Candidatus Micrarchaeota archaeon]
MTLNFKANPDVRSKQKTVVLVHGYTGSRREWGKQGEALREKNCRVVAFDLAGHGESVLNGSNKTSYLKDNARILVSSITAMGVVNPQFVAHSMGALVFLEYAKLTIGTPLFPASSVLVAPELGDPRYLGPGGLLSGSSLIARARLNRFNNLVDNGQFEPADDSLNATIRLFQALGPATMKTFGATDAAVSEFKQYLFRLRNLDPHARRVVMQAQIERGAELRAQLTCKEIQLPNLLVLGGSVDLLMDAKKVATILNDSGVKYVQKIIPDAGHFIHLEQPETFTNLLLNFLNISH